MRRLTKVKYWFWLLLLLGLVSRVAVFGKIPTSLNRDEAALGYNAWAIWNYQLDEWGEYLPVTFKSLGDYKLPGYIYALAPIVGILGVSDQVIRLPSLLAGLLLILATGWWLSLLFGKKFDSRLVMLGVAVSPFTIFYSRMAYEANVALLLVVVVLALLTAPESTWRRVWLALVYLAACLTYNTPLLLIPVLVAYAWLLVGFSKKRKLGDSLLLVGVAIIVTLMVWSAISQKSAITIFSDPALILAQQAEYMQATTLWQKIGSHWSVFYTGQLLTRTLDTFSPHFLVLQGGKNPWHTVPGTGHLYWSVYITALLGILLGIKNVKRTAYSVPLLVLTLGSLLPAVTTVDAPHATRSLLFILCLLVWSSWLVSAYKKWFYFFALVTIVELVVYGYKYFLVFPKTAISEWSVGFAESIHKALIESNTEPIYVAIEEGVADDLVSRQVYIFTLLYSQTPPTDYIRSATLLPADPAGIIRVSRFGRFRFDVPQTEIPSGSNVIWRSDQGVYSYAKK